jgi:hypothetical protein
MSEQHGSDKAAAFRGLVVTAILLFLLVISIVKLTNRAYSSGEGAHATRTK